MCGESFPVCPAPQPPCLAPHPLHHLYNHLPPHTPPPPSWPSSTLRFQLPASCCSQLHWHTLSLLMETEAMEQKALFSRQWECERLSFIKSKVGALNIKAAGRKGWKVTWLDSKIDFCTELKLQRRASNPVFSLCGCRITFCQQSDSWVHLVV